MWMLPWWRRRWGKAAVTFVTKPPSPTRLAFDLGVTRLDATGIQPTQLAFGPILTALGFQGDDGDPMSTPLIFTAGETGPITLTFTGADGTAENLSTAQSVTWTMANARTGALKVSAVALTSPTSSGTAIWTRLSTEIDVAGDYLGQAKVVRSDGTIGYYPDGERGYPITLLKQVGS